MTERIVLRKPRKQKFDPQVLVETFRTWAHYKGDEERAKAQKDTLRADALFPALESHGEEDDKGSFVLTFPEPVTINTISGNGVKKSVTYVGIKKEKRPSMIFQEDKAEEWLEKNDLLDQVQVTSTTHTVSWDFNLGKPVKETNEATYLNQDAIYLLNQEGKISDRALDSFFKESITWALVPIKA